MSDWICPCGRVQYSPDIHIESDRIFGNEKKKLVIQPIGIIVYEFLEKYFDNLFNYDYTKEMEDDLRDVLSKKKRWNDPAYLSRMIFSRMIKPLYN